jgi:hypothetical protein
MQAMARIYYKNNYTKSVVFIIEMNSTKEEESTLIRAKYLDSNHKTWFKTEDFHRIFTKIQ